MNGWKTYKAEEFCLTVTDGTHDSPKPKTCGRYLITSKHLKPSGIDFSSANKISEEDYNKIIQRSKVEQYDILFSMIGTIGNIHRVTISSVDFAVKNMGIFKMGGDANRSLWMYYWLQSPEAKEYINSRVSGSTQGYLTLGNLREFPIRVPSRIEEQKKITDILSAIDDKIEVNRRINDNLEQQAQALFKSWFVDFEPFKDGEFVESELGMIPEGWKVGALGDLIEIKYGKDHKKLNDGDIPVYGSGGIMRYVDKSLFAGESVLIPRKGTLNNVMYVNQDFWTVDTMFFSKMKMSNIAIFVYLFLSKKDLASMNSGSAVPSMTVDILNKISLVIPNEKTFENFNNIVSTLFFQMSNNAKEINHLITLRDTLLPKLMSEGFVF